MPDPCEAASFQPANALEEALLKCWKDRTELGLFAMRLFSSQVVVLLRAKGDVLPRKWPAPLIIRGVNDKLVLAVFTSIERTIPWRERHEEFQHALVTDASWVLRNAPPGYGVAINPGWAVGMEIPPDDLARLLRDFGENPGTATLHR
jgi:DNA-binding transcriptional LysR family regulator